MSVPKDTEADTGPPDTGPPDTAPPDTGPPDTGPPDTGPPDTGPRNIPPRNLPLRNLRHVGPALRMVRVRGPSLPTTTQRLERALTIADLRALAARRAPRAVFDYTDGGAEAELSMARARAAFTELEWQPRVLTDVSAVNCASEVLGGPVAYPFGIAPTGFTRLMHTEGELAGASAAGEYGIPFALSTLGTTSIENVRQANPEGRNWFQLYVMKKREVSYDLLARADAAGFDTVLVTVDAPVAGRRLRDQRNGFSIPPSLSWATVFDTVRRPAWWVNYLTTPPLEFASLTSTGGTVAELLDSAMDPSINYSDLTEIRRQWTGKLVVKGVQSVADARALADFGVDGIVLSNHGGRQLDRSPVPFLLLPEVVREVGQDLEVMVDGGVMSGADIVACTALGAKLTFVGRAYLYGLMAGGQAGVRRALEILTSEIVRTMKLLGVSSIAELKPHHVNLLA